jgi:formylmethanofuran dehydrogenase subunit E
MRIIFLTPSLHETGESRSSSATKHRCSKSPENKTNNEYFENQAGYIKRKASNYFFVRKIDFQLSIYKKIFPN